MHAFKNDTQVYYCVINDHSSNVITVSIKFHLCLLIKRQSPSISKTPNQGVESRGYPQEREDDKKIGFAFQAKIFFFLQPFLYLW